MARKPVDPQQVATRTAARMTRAATRGDAAFARAQAAAERAVATLRADAWNNVYTGAGIAGKDKLESSIFRQRARIDWSQLTALYRQNWLAKRLVDDLCGDAVRAGFALEVDKDDELPTKWQDAMDALHAFTRAQDGLRWSLVYGGAVGLLVTEDAAFARSGVGVQTSSGIMQVGVLATPLQESQLRAVKQILIVDARYALPDITAYTDDPDSANFGIPEFYQVTPYGQATNTTSYKVHWTRLLRFDGVPTDMLTRVANLTWGDSIYESAWDALMRYGMAYQGAAITAQEFAQGVLSVKDLAALMGSEQYAAILARAQGFKMGLGTAGLAIIDAEGETYTRMGQPVSGLDSLLELFKQEVSGVARIPEQRLYGNQAGKLAGAGEDHRLWAEYVHAWQTKSVIPQLTTLTRLWFASKDGPTGGKVPAKWKITPNPIDPPDLDKEIERRLKQSQIDHTYFGDGVLEPGEIRDSRYGGAEYSYETTLDAKISDAIKAQEERAATEKQAPPEPAPPPNEPKPPEPPAPAPAEG